MTRLPTEMTFLKDVAEHEMTVIRDDGLYRHVRFAKPKTGNMHFDVVTWPGFLCYSGDMGCYVFSRIPDMLEFFRSDTRDDGPLYINPGYWGEKVQAIDRCSPMEEFSPEKFKQGIERWLDEAEATDDIREAVAEEVLSRAEDGEHEAMRAAMEFSHRKFTFDCFYEINVRDISYRFLWCCYALAWAVRKYDARPNDEDDRRPCSSSSPPAT